MIDTYPKGMSKQVIGKGFGGKKTPTAIEFFHGRGVLHNRMTCQTQTCISDGSADAVSYAEFLGITSKHRGSNHGMNASF